MATVLDQYNQKKVQITAQITAGKFPAEQMLQYQEMLYRIDVLETCMAFCRTAPVTSDQRVLGSHYRLLDCFLNCVLQERRIGIPTDEKGQKQRETAYNNFLTVVNTFRKKFHSFAPNSQDEYHNTIAQKADGNEKTETIIGGYRRWLLKRSIMKQSLPVSRGIVKH